MFSQKTENRKSFAYFKHLMRIDDKLEETTEKETNIHQKKSHLSHYLAADGAEG